MADLKPGWVVVGNDGHRVGSIREVGQNYLLASTGGLSGNVYIPASAIGNVEHETVHLNVAQRDVAEMDWEEPPREEDAPVTSPEADLHRHV
jgi:hypothetical protein